MNHTVCDNCRHLNTNFCCSAKTKNPEEGNSVVELYVQIGPDDLALRSMLDMVDQVRFHVLPHTCLLISQTFTPPPESCLSVRWPLPGGCISAACRCSRCLSDTPCLRPSCQNERQTLVCTVLFFFAAAVSFDHVGLCVMTVLLCMACRCCMSLAMTPCVPSSSSGIQCTAASA